MRRPAGLLVIKRVPLFRIASQESLDSPIDRRSDYYRQRAREERPPGSASAPAEPALQPLLNTPNALTLFRIVLVPVVVALWFSSHRLAPLAAAATFVVAAVTDWADGYLARKARRHSAACS